MAINYHTCRVTRARPCVIALAVSSAVHARAEDMLRRYEAEAGRAGGDMAAANLVLEEWEALVSWAARDAWESCDYAGWWWSPWWRRRQVWAALNLREYLAELWRR